MSKKYVCMSQAKTLADLSIVEKRDDDNECIELPKARNQKEMARQRQPTFLSFAK